MRVKGLKRGLGIGLAFVLSAAMAIPGAAVDTFAAEVEDSILEPETSTVYDLNTTKKLSDLPNKPIVLTGDATIEVDVDGTLPMIVEMIEDAQGVKAPVSNFGTQCNYSLTIKGDKTLKTSFISCKNLIVQSGTLEVDKKSDLKFDGGDVYGPAILATNKLTVSGGKIIAKNETEAGISLTEYEQTDGDVSINSNGHALQLMGGATISGGTFDAVATAIEAVAFEGPNDFKISGEKTKISIESKNSKYAFYNMPGGKVTISDPLKITTPENGKIVTDKYNGTTMDIVTVVGADGKPSSKMVIENPSASGNDDKKDDDKNDDQNDDKKEEDKKEDESNSTVDPQKVNSCVSDLYKSAFGREATEGEIKTWADQVVSGEISYANLLVGIIQSPEFKNKQTTDKEYVISLYTTIFGRTPTDEEVKNWTDKISGGMSRDEVMRGFVNSEEAGNNADAMGIPQGKMMSDGTIHYNKGINDFVSRCYTVVLGRKGEKTGVDYWTEKIYNKEYTPEQVITGFVDSKEFANRELSDDEFLEVLYKTFFDRASDEAGKADWSKQLKDGKKRIDIIPGFARSVEFKNLLAKYGM